MKRKLSSLKPISQEPRIQHDSIQAHPPFESAVGEKVTEASSPRRGRRSIETDNSNTQLLNEKQEPDMHK